MYCPNCGNENVSSAKFCINCGKALTVAEQTPSPPVAALSQLQEEPGRGATILVLGILSMIMLGFIAGIPAWVMGNRDLRKIRDGTIAAGQWGLTAAGRVLGIIGTLLTLGAAVAVVVVIALTIVAARTASVGVRPEGLAAISPEYAAKSGSLSSYDDIEQIRGQTADDPPAIFLMQVSLGYNPKDKEVSVEIGNRRREIQDIILKDISHKHAADLSESHYEKLQAELKDLINQVMRDGKIQSVMFRTFVVQK
jgi:flagellar basal body-associated protein FliL/predicted nucleic acid-binding Zn ribbon protein